MGGVGLAALAPSGCEIGRAIRERDRLSRGGAAKESDGMRRVVPCGHDAEDRTRELEAKLETLREEKAEIESGHLATADSAGAPALNLRLEQQKAELDSARLTAAKAAEGADALSSGTDLSMANKELQVLRDAQQAASQRVQAVQWLPPG
eukprot:Skav217985  [mRNA]  locus=scaffold496:493390:503971:- [translate_table: standard]